MTIEKSETMDACRSELEALAAKKLGYSRWWSEGPELTAILARYRDSVLEEAAKVAVDMGQHWRIDSTVGWEEGKDYPGDDTSAAYWIATAIERLKAKP